MPPKKKKPPAAVSMEDDPGMGEDPKLELHIDEPDPEPEPEPTPEEAALPSGCLALNLSNYSPPDASRSHSFSLHIPPPNPALFGSRLLLFPLPVSTLPLGTFYLALPLGTVHLLGVSHHSPALHCLYLSLPPSHAVSTSHSVNTFRCRSW